MSSENIDNLYVLEDEDNKETDDSPLNFAAYNEEDREEEPEEKTEGGNKSAFGLLFYIMFNPVEGWKKLRRSKIKVESLQSSCFYPLLAILAISKFSEFFYSVNINLQQVITQAIITFVSFFFAYFCIQMIINWLLPKELSNKIENSFGKEYTVVALSTLALFSIFTTLLPMLWPILIFLPIWTLYIMFKGIRFFKLPVKEEMKFYLIESAAVIGIPLLIDWALNSVLPY